MAKTDQDENPYIEDGTVDFSGGQDAYHWPDRIAENCYANSVNIKTDKGILRPRDAFVRQEITFSDQTVKDDKNRNFTIDKVFRTGHFQAFIPYYISPEYQFVVIIEGYLFKYNSFNRTVSLITDEFTLNPLTDRVNWSLAGRYIVLFDFPNYPLIIDRDHVFRANPQNTINGVLQPQVPISTIGAFNQNRLFVGNAGNEFLAGDPVGNPLTPEAPITFTEVLSNVATYPGQSFSLGTNLNTQPITAMGFLQSVDQGTGLGPLFVATENSMYYYRTDLPRAQWAAFNAGNSATTPFGSLLLFNAGVVGPRAVVNVNSDLIFLSGEGKVHALSTARNDAKTWGNVPISREVENWLKFWDPSLRKYAFLQYFNNRIYVSANPYRVRTFTINNVPVNDYVHGGMVTLNINTIASLHSEATPVWDGLWTGMRPMDMALTNNRAFIIGKDVNNENHIWEVIPNQTYDVVNNKALNIDSQVETREYFASSRFTNKYEQSITMPVQNVEGDLKVFIYRRPSHAVTFKLWKAWEYYAPFSQCNGVEFPNGLAAHRFRELIFGAPDPQQDCEPGNGITYSPFRKLQLRINISARSWQIEELKVRSTANPSDDLDNTCAQSGLTKIPEPCFNYWAIKGEDLCNP